MNKNEVKKSTKPKVNTLRPCLRDKKRYLAFEIMSDKPLMPDADKALISKISELLGAFSSAKAGVMRVNYFQNTQRGVLRVDRAFVDFIRSCFVMIKKINNQEVMIRTLYVSGMVKKAAEHTK